LPLASLSLSVSIAPRLSRAPVTRDACAMTNMRRICEWCGGAFIGRRRYCCNTCMIKASVYRYNESCRGTVKGQMRYQRLKARGQERMARLLSHG
jgi:hypothetical protein